VSNSGWLWNVERPRTYWEVVGVHFAAAFLSGLLLFAALFVPLDRLPIPSCTFLTLTGYPCPFCGSTRAFVDMAHGRFGAAFLEHPWAAVLYIVTALIFAWNAAALLCGVVLKRGCLLRPSRRISAILWAFVGCSLTATWIYRVVAGLK
jgi:hypothetical protein